MLAVVFILSVPATSQADDHGTNFNTAPTVSIGSVTPGMIEDVFDEDYFSFTVLSEGVYVIYSRGGLLLNGFLYNSVYLEIQSDYDNSGEEGNFYIQRFLSAGAYFIKVSTDWDSPLGEYEIRVEGPGAGTTSDDHGFSCWSATPVSVGSVKSGAIDVQGDRDFFRFTVRSNATYVIFTRGWAGTDYCDMAMWNAAYGTVIRPTRGGAEDLNTRIEQTLSPGTYYVEIWSDLGETSSYDLHIEGPGAPTTTDDHGFSSWSATPVAVGSVTPGAIDVEGDRDFFKFTVASNGTYVIYSRGALSLDGALYDSTYNLATASFSMDGEEGNFRIEHSLAPGTYYLEVREEVGFMDSYEVHVEGPGAGTQSDDHGFSCWSATPVALGSATPGAIDVEGDRDFFKFTVERNGTYALYSEGTLSLSGRLYDGAYQLITGSTGVGDENFRIEEFLEPGTYYVEVSVHMWSGGGGNYDVHIGTAEVATGSLRVTLNPPEALAEGAQWRRLTTPGFAWHNGGDTEADIPVGSYSVEFKPTVGWSAPPNQEVVITNGQTTTASATYTSVIVLSTAVLDFGDTQTQLPFEVFNDGLGTLDYQFVGLPDWVTGINPPLGTSLKPSNPQSHLVTIDRSKLALGQNAGQITVSAPRSGNSFRILQLRAMKRKISGTIVFKNRAGGPVGVLHLPKQPVMVTLWRSVGQDYRWAGPRAEDTFVTATFIDHAWVDDFPFDMNMPGLVDGDYIIGFSVHGADLKVLPVTVRNGYATDLHVVLTYEDVVSLAVQEVLCRKSSPNVKYRLGAWQAATPEQGAAETNGLRRALDTWAHAGPVRFIETTNDDWDIHFQKSRTQANIGGILGPVYARASPGVSRSLTTYWEVEFAADVSWDSTNWVMWDGFSTWQNASLDLKSFEAAAMHEIGHVLGLRYSEFFGCLNPVQFFQCEDAYPDCAGQQWSIMTYFSSLFGAAWPGWSDVEALKSINRAATFAASCPVDIMVTDHAGRITTRTNAEIPTSHYYESDGEGETNHVAVVVIEEPIGTKYQVTVTPRPEAQTNSTFSLFVQSGNGDVPVTLNLPLGDLGSHGFNIYAEPGLVRWDSCAFQAPLDRAGMLLQQGTSLPIRFHLVDGQDEPIADQRSLVMEVSGPDAAGQSLTNVFSTNDGSLAFSANTSPPEYVATFDTRSRSVKAGGEYLVVVRQYGAPIGTATLIVSANQDSRVRILECKLLSDSRVTLQWASLTESVWVESSGDLQTWETVAGPVSANPWTGVLPAGRGQVFYRIRALVSTP